MRDVLNSLRFRQIAIHEAGHAVAALDVGEPFRKVWARPHGGRIVVKGDWALDTTGYVIMMFGGQVAEKLWCERNDRVFDSECSERDTNIIREAIEFSSHTHLDLRARTSRIVTARWVRIERLADALMTRRSVSYEQAGAV